MGANAFLNCLSFQDLGEETGDHKEETLKQFSSQLLSIAKRHECYSMLWNICCDLNDSELLKNLMVQIWLFMLVNFVYLKTWCEFNN